jgi:uncharacterized membrane protein YdjX (TVP38/TMEM64 family)
MADEQPRPEARSFRQSVVRVVGFGLFAALLVWASLCRPVREFFSFEHIRQTTDALGALGPLAIVAFGIVSPLLFLPRWPLAMVAGLLYGVTRGVLLSTFASALGALLQFYLARSLLAGLAARLIARSRLAGMTIRPDKTFAAIFLLRAFPFSNFVATNLLAGAMRLHVVSYLAASFLGMLPSSYMYAACGKFMKNPSPIFLLSAFACVTLIAAGTIVTRRHWSRWLGGDKAPD